MRRLFTRKATKAEVDTLDGNYAELQTYYDESLSRHLNRIKALESASNTLFVTLLALGGCLLATLWLIRRLQRGE